MVVQTKFVILDSQENLLYLPVVNSEVTLKMLMVCLYTVYFHHINIPHVLNSETKGTYHYMMILWVETP